MHLLLHSSCISQAICRPAKHFKLRRGSPDSGCCRRRPLLLSQWQGLSKGSVRWGSSVAGPGDEDHGDRESGTWFPWSWRPGGRGPASRRLSLSPLERVSSLIPGQLLSKEVLGLRGQQPASQELAGNNVPRNASETTASPGLPVSNTAKEVSFKMGDLVLAEFRRRHRLELRKMFMLATGGVLHSKWGMLTHQEILGHLPGQVFSTSIGSKFVLRRPTLEEFVLLMKRGPTISYPKDATTMLMMMDVGIGDCVLESGSGSGAMTLFLSRAVGSSGHVYSFEVRKDHHGRAERNYQCWRNAYEVAREKEWPKNVDFINKDIVFATDDIQGKMFDAIALDMLSPQLALPVIYTHLKQGGICAVYLTNITQVIDLLEGIRSSRLSLSCEKILEVIHRDWFVIPALRKDGSTAARVEPQRNKIDLQHKERNDTAKIEDNGKVKTMILNLFAQCLILPDLIMNKFLTLGTIMFGTFGFTGVCDYSAFLIKLRKLKTALQ